MFSFPQASEDPALNFTLHTVELHAPDLAAADAARAQAGPATGRLQLSPRRLGYRLYFIWRLRPRFGPTLCNLCQAEPEPAAELAVGAPVVVHGLQGAPEHNGAASPG